MLVVVACATASTHPFPVSSLTVGDVELSVWTADDPAQRRQGLRDVAGLPDGIDGMVFVYGTPGSASYEMENTLIPLDIWWFDENGALIGTDEMTPCPAEPCEDYVSPGPVLTVLETPLGDHEFETGAVISNVENG